MTTGTKQLSTFFTQWYAPGQVYLKFGRRWYKTWNGGDSKPSLQPKAPHGPKYYSLKRTVLPRNWTRELQPNAYSMYQLWQGPSLVYARRVAGANTNSYQLDAVPVNYTHVPPDPSDTYKVIQKLASQVFGSGFHPGIFLAEMPEALSMIANGLERVITAINALFRGRPRDAATALNIVWSRHLGGAYSRWQQGKITFSALWLEFSYGWKPLLQDIEEGTKYAQFAVSGVASKVCKCSRSRRFKGTRVDTPIHQGYGLTTANTAGIVRITAYNLRGTSLTLPPLASVAAVVWEKLPWSFVFDWALPIGDYLQALRNAANIQGTFCTTVLSETTWTNMRLGTGWVSGIIDPGYGGIGDYREVTMSRTISSTLVPPNPTGTCEPMEVFSSWQRCANALALFTQKHASAKLGDSGLRVRTLQGSL